MAELLFVINNQENEIKEMYKLYKPTKSVKGSCLQLNCDDLALKNGKPNRPRAYLSIAPQASWNDDKGYGSFAYDKKLTIALNALEVVTLFKCIKNHKAHTFFHKGADTTTVLNLNGAVTKKDNEWVNDWERGVSVSLSKGKGSKLGVNFLKASEKSLEEVGDFAETLKIIYTKLRVAEEEIEKIFFEKSKENNSSSDSPSNSSDDDDDDCNF